MNDTTRGLAFQARPVPNNPETIHHEDVRYDSDGDQRLVTVEGR